MGRLARCRRFAPTGIKPVPGHWRNAELTAPALLSALRRIEHRGAHDLAHRVLQVSGQVLRYGVATGRCERDQSNDLRGALTPHKGRHQAAVTPEELPALLRAIDGYAELGDKMAGYALRLLALTFVRTGELIGATWDEIDMDDATWIIPNERMKMRTEHVVPLSMQALAILREVRAIGGGSRYVFPGRNPDKPMSNNTMLFAFYRLGYKGKMTGHGFRTVESTVLNEAGFRADVNRASTGALRAQRCARCVQPRRVPARAQEDDAAVVGYDRRASPRRKGHSLATSRPVRQTFAPRLSPLADL